MTRDIRGTTLYREAERLCSIFHRPGTGTITDAVDICASPDGRHAIFAGTLLDRPEGTPQTRLCEVDLSSGRIRVLTFGPNSDRIPSYSLDGRRVAFLSDRHEAGDFQLQLFDLEAGTAGAVAIVDGCIEYLQWSPDGKRILLGVADHGADLSTSHGAMTDRRVNEKNPSWMPIVANQAKPWRSVWIYELASNVARRISGAGCNVWEASWCGNAALAVVVSSAPTEGHWYSARLGVMDVLTSEVREIYVPTDQLGLLCASPSGRRLAFVEAICSDRGIVAGDLRVGEVESGRFPKVSTAGVDVSHVEWCSERELLIAGIRGSETVVGVCDVQSGSFHEVHRTSDLSTSGYTVKVARLNVVGDCLLVGEGFACAPHIAVVESGKYRVVRLLAAAAGDGMRSIGTVERLCWGSPDGIEIQGWLLASDRTGPHPLILNIHGGPVWSWRPTWLGRAASTYMLMLLNRGYAFLLPNPRGSSGRGQEFTKYVIGDVGGADTHDHLSGLDHLVSRRLADPKRLGVMGGSYGGYMTSWLISQDNRFAAAVSVAPITNHYSHYFTSYIPPFVELFVGDDRFSAASKYWQRSPLFHASKVRTPTLNICGTLDRCTPPTEAVQFHNALRENGTKSAMVMYPEEGHGIRNFPAIIDFSARCVGWFEEHMAA